VRLQLRILAAALLASPLVLADPWRTGVDTLVYTDTDSVLVISPQVSVHRALDPDGGEVAARALVDIVSAASVDVVAQASQRFDEIRTEADLHASKAFGSLLPSVGYHFSNEPDYLSNGGNVGLRTRLGTPDTVLGLRYGLTYDRIGRSGTPFSVFERTLASHSAEASLTQVLGPTQLVRLAYTLTVQDGYLEKPYRYVPLFDDAGASAIGDGHRSLATIDGARLSTKPPEEVPDLRAGHSFALRGLQYLRPLHASLRLDVQLYLDSWGIVAQSYEPALHARLSEHWRARVYGRLYLQQNASFWRRLYVVPDRETIPRYRTIDRELSTYHTWMAGARIEWAHEPFAAYGELSGMWTSFSDYLLLDHRIALVGQIGVRFEP
jgi:hypothetical protein